MIYKSLHLFPAEAKEELIALVVNKYFYKLFFSWSWNVRSLITHVLLYQLHFIHFELVNMINDKNKHDKTPKQAKFDDTLIRNLLKPKKTSPVVVDSDDEVHYDQKMCKLIRFIFSPRIRKDRNSSPHNRYQETQRKNGGNRFLDLLLHREAF